VTLPSPFATGYSGTKTIDLYAENATGAHTGWQTRGTWTVPGPGATLTADAVTPATGTGASQVFTATFGDTAGATDLTVARVRLASAATPGPAGVCTVSYARAANTLALVTDGGASGTALPLGGGGTLQNSQCAVTLGPKTTATLSGPTLTLALDLAFAPAFAGTMSVDLSADNAVGTTGWVPRGTWTVPAVAATVTADTATPGAGSGATQTFALQYGDTAGPADLSTTWVWFKGGASTANACIVYYSPVANTVNLLNDAGTVWLPAALGTSGTLQNSQCTIALGGTTATRGWTTLTLQLPVTFATSYSGTKTIDLYAENATGAHTGWQTRGTWTVQ
jgi:large repetitive protein